VNRIIVPHPLASLVATVLVLTACSPPATAPSAAIETSPAAPPQLTGTADIIFTNGTILTLDDSMPRAAAIAIQGDKILAVGDEAEMLAQRGPDTVLIDLGGRTLVPGFIDAHQHRILNAIQGSSNLEDNLRSAIEQGWTSMGELYVEPEYIEQYISFDRQGKYRLRVDMYLAFNRSNGDPIEDWYKAYQPGQVFSPRLRIAGLKVFTDFDNATVLVWKQPDLNAVVLDLYRQGWPLAIKTVSTRSLEMILDAIEAAHQVEPNIANHRIRLEHALFLTPEQIARTKQLGVIPAINLNNPGQLVGEADVDELIAREPEGSYTPWRSLLEAGIPAANTSGWPSYYVDEPTGAAWGSPVHLIYQAVTRVGNFGKQPYPWLLDQTITAEQALRVLTINGAYATSTEDVKGSLTTGKFADMVILSDDPLSVAAADINNIEVLMTMIDGRVEFCAAGLEALCPSIPVASGPTPAPATTVPSATMPGTAVELHKIAAVSASAILPDGPVENAVDGDPETVWNSGAAPKQWVRFEFESPRRVSSIRLIVSQYPDGNTVHRIWGGPTEDSVQLLHEFIGSTVDGQFLEFQWPIPVESIQILYVVTTDSPSWVAWREIEVRGY